MGEFVRLQKYIAMCGVTSRRKAEELITDGRVRVDGKKVTELGTKVEIGASRVEVDGRAVRLPKKMYYIMLNKPAGYVSTVSDQFDRPTVTDLVSGEVSARLFPVGRLDYDTEGLLLLTNDGEFAQRVAHPKFNMNKTYVATISGGLTPAAVRRLRAGVRLDDGFVTSPAEVELLDGEKGKSTVQITIHEGKNRQVRRMFEAVGCRVEYLRRISVGILELGNLPLGRWRYLTAHEVNYLKNI